MQAIAGLVYGWCRPMWHGTATSKSVRISRHCHRRSDTSVATHVTRAIPEGVKIQETLTPRGGPALGGEKTGGICRAQTVSGGYNSDIAVRFYTA